MFLTLFNKRKDNVPTYSINKEDFTNFTVTNITKVPLSYEIKENNNSYRGSKDFFNKLITILPVQIEKMRVDHILDISEVIIEQDINSKRLFDYFIFPKFESSVNNLKFATYIRMVKLLVKLGYKEDEIFWKNHILDAIKSFHLCLENAYILKSTLELVEKALNVDVEIYLKKVNEIIESLKIIKEKDASLGITKIRNISFNLESENSRIKESKMYKKEFKELKNNMKGNFKGSKMNFDEISNALKKSIEEKKNINETLQEYELKRKAKEEPNKKEKKDKTLKKKENKDKKDENLSSMNNEIKNEVTNNKI